MIIGRDLIRSLGIDIHGVDMTIHWDDSAIPWRDIYSKAKYVFALSQHNAPFNAETKRMKHILNAKYSKADIKTNAESSTHLDPQERNELYTILKKYKSLFDGNLGTWHGKTYDIKLLTGLISDGYPCLHIGMGRVYHAMCLYYHQTSFHTYLIGCIAHFFLEGQDEWSFLRELISFFLFQH